MATWREANANIDLRVSFGRWEHHWVNPFAIGKTKQKSRDFLVLPIVKKYYSPKLNQLSCAFTFPHC
ncbi:hypothetical protein IQ259_25140 [Fortiea sp. LEGE XX443]|uniref:hypothetical protein n=1 Tax=Fortiea sp. LEGE XX443 TaxID=1828611 RepID=UPI001880BC98|nr:hypothetical protein [Fortiea sp. LEGE XX443]MBE9008258.1 hypothetical protein [Fortiea sp. LEGE XX443]